MNVRIKDIAKLADVSAATVSLALNNKPGVSEPTRQKILKITKSLSESLNENFNQINSGSIKFLIIVKHGHVLNRDHDVFIASYIDGLEEETRTNGYNLEINNFVSTNTPTIVNLFNNASIDGLVVLGTELEEEDIRAFEQLKIPVVFIDTFIDYLNFDFIDMNNIEAAFQIVKEFKKEGHTEIGFIRGSLRNFELRECGFKNALKYFGLPLIEKYFFTVDSTFNGAYSDMLQLLNKGSNLPTAFFCCNDIIAYGCIKAFKEKGIRVPDDVSVIGFDDIPMSTFMDPPLTTMRVSKKEIGKTAIKLIIDKHKNNSVATKKIIIDGELVIRESVKELGTKWP